MLGKELVETNQEHVHNCVDCESDSSGNHSEFDEINMILNGKLKLDKDSNNGDILRDFIEDFGFEEPNHYESPDSKIRAKGFASEAEA